MIISPELDQHAAVAAALAAAGKSQAGRIIQLLHNRGPQLTSVIASEAAIGNVSDAAARANSRYLEPHGYRIVAELPKPLTRNRYGQPSQQNLWRLVRVDK